MSCLSLLISTSARRLPAASCEVDTLPAKVRRSLPAIASVRRESVRVNLSRIESAARKQTSAPPPPCANNDRQNAVRANGSRNFLIRANEYDRTRQAKENRLSSAEL